jgi:hypothetical protein
MKAKMVVLVVVLLLVAMVPALVMAGSQAKPEQTASIHIDIRKPLGPQLDAQLGVSARGPRSVNAVVVPSSRGAAAQAPQPNAVYGLLNEGFEGSLSAWNFAEYGSPVGWDSTMLDSKRGQYSFYSAAYNNDEFAYPYYDNDMEAWAWTDMDLQGARRVQVRFQFKNDSELGWDYFWWCASADGWNYYCDGHTGSTNDKWRLVTMDSRNNPILADALGSPFASFAFIFTSDPYCCVDTGAFVDVLRIRAWGP